MDDEDRTRVIPAIKPQHIGPTPVRSRQLPSEDREERHEPSDPAGKRKKSKKPILWISLTLLLLLAMTAVVLYVNHKLVVPNVIVPKVIGQTEADARKMLNDRGLEVDPNIIRAYKPDVREGIVYNQSRSEGTEVKKGSLVQLSVGSAETFEKDA
ncbi:PASTA domain-containing protein [Paenibacillus sp. JTLBN-2024]